MEVPLTHAPSPPAAEAQWFELWVTDAGIDLDALHLSVAKVVVDESALTVKRPQFDLLEHQGIRGGFLLASGSIRANAAPRVQIAFSSAVAEIGGQAQDLGTPFNLLTLEPSLGAGSSEGQAFLIDLNATQSIVFNGTHLNFVPHVDAAYARDLAEASRPEAAPPDFAAEARVQFQQARTAIQSNELPNLGSPVRDAIGDAGDEVDPAKDVLKDEYLDDAQPVQDQVEGFDTGGPVKGWLVLFRDDVTEAEKALTIEAHGASPVFFFATVHAGYVWARDDQAWELSQNERIVAVDPDRPVEYLLSTSKTAIRVPDLANPLTGIKDAAGNPIDGRGVGVAVVDVGIDGTHPDLPHHLIDPSDPVLLANFKVASAFVSTADVPTTDDASGHGTHVAGILAGRGASDPTHKGVAPGVKVYAFGTGEADTTLWTYQALDWISQNHDEVSPRIKIVTNSWTVAGTGNADATLTQIVNGLVSKGVTVVFAAGNYGNTAGGSRALTTGECRIAAVVCVAAYDDQGTGTRNGKIASYSSRGATAMPSTWPDLSAPGTDIRAPAPLLGSETLISPNLYSTLDGTSMAAPHVAGVAALMLQANPDLSPAAIQVILKATAFKFSDGGAYSSNGSHPGKGYGLVDAYAAVAVAKAS